jgi:hypothetical protein
MRFRAARKGDAGIVQKDEIGVRRTVRASV